MNNRLYVENLPPGATETSLRELFSKQGAVTDVKLMTDATTGVSRGRAFVTMATPELAQSAIKSLHSHSLGGRNIAVTQARPPEQHTTGLIGQGFEAGIGRERQMNTGNTRKPAHGRRRPQRSR